MQFVVDKFHTLPYLTVSVFLLVGQKGQFLNLFLSSPRSSDQFPEGASILGGMSGLCLAPFT